MSELSKKFFVATTVLEQTDSGFVESRLDNVPDPVAVPAARTSTLYDELKAQREMADAAHLERFKHKPPRGLDEDDELFLMTRGNEEKSVAERERTQANSDRQEFQMRLATRNIQQVSVDEPVDLASLPVADTAFSSLGAEKKGAQSSLISRLVKVKKTSKETIGQKRPQASTTETAPAAESSSSAKKPKAECGALSLLGSYSDSDE